MTELRAPFNKIDNPYLWAVLIDLADVFGWIPVVGEAMDIIQGVAALIIFDEPLPVIATAAVELCLPGPLDLFPSYTAAVWYLEHNKG